MSLRQKYFLDTTIFYECIKMEASEFEEKLKQYAPGRKHAAYYTVIELNRGLFYVLIQHYRNVERMQDVPRALIELSNKFGGRKSKIGLIALAYIMDKFGKVDGCYQRYLVELELAMADMNDKFKDLVSSFMGSFKDNPIANLNIYSREDYDALINAREESESISYSEDFWYKMRPSVAKMREALQVKVDSGKNLGKQKAALLTFLESMSDINQITKYKSIGDLIVALECPKNYKIIAKDRWFAILAPLLSREHIIWR